MPLRSAKSLDWLGFQSRLTLFNDLPIVRKFYGSGENNPPQKFFLHTLKQNA
jgi:hypothetical protein